MVEVCTNVSCALVGAQQVLESFEQELGIRAGETTDDGEVTLRPIECLGGCVNAPVVQINDDFYEDLDEASLAKVLDAFRRGETPKAGPQVDRQTSAPEGGALTLKGE